MKRRGLWIAAGVLVVALVAGGLAALAGLSDFDLGRHEARDLVFDHKGEQIAGTLVLPVGVENPPIAVIVHGDGAQDRYSGGGYLPLFNTLIDAGIGIFAYDKQGVGESTGNWLDQSMQDRADQALAARRAVAEATGDAARVGFLGFSQAGWVLPKAASQEEPAFTVIVGGAVSWREQGAYYTRRRLEAEGIDSDRIAATVRDELAANDALFGSADAGGGRDDMSPDRFAFVKRSYLADARADIAMMQGPVLAVWGADDLNVSADYNSGIYAEELAPGPQREVRVIPGATHGLLRASIYNYQLASDWPGWKQALYTVSGRRAYAPGAIEGLAEWISSVTPER